MEWRWNLEKLEKRRKTQETQQEFKKAARQLGALDDVPLSLKTCYKDIFFKRQPSYSGNLSFMVKTTTSATVGRRQ